MNVSDMCTNALNNDQYIVYSGIYNRSQMLSNLFGKVSSSSGCLGWSTLFIVTLPEPSI